MTSRDNWPAEFQSNGERIYFTATSASGLPIRPMGGGMHMEMMGGGCVTCHGADRLGGRMMPRIWVAIPPLTAAALFDAHAAGNDGDTHGSHESYNEQTLRQAITRGIDPGGEPLDPAMPRWSISDQDFDDLIIFLKTPVERLH